MSPYEGTATTQQPPSGSGPPQMSRPPQAQMPPGGPQHHQMGGPYGYPGHRGPQQQTMGMGGPPGGPGFMQGSAPTGHRGMPPPGMSMGAGGQYPGCQSQQAPYSHPSFNGPGGQGQHHPQHQPYPPQHSGYPPQHQQQHQHQQHLQQHLPQHPGQSLNSQHPGQQHPRQHQQHQHQGGNYHQQQGYGQQGYGRQPSSGPTGMPSAPQSSDNGPLSYTQPPSGSTNNVDSSSGDYGQQFLPTGLNGDWQSDRDMHHRREMIQHIVKLLKQKDKNASPEWLTKLPQMVKQLEVSLYRSAPSFSAYADTSTLKHRLQQLAMEIARKTQQAKSDGSNSDGRKSDRSNQSMSSMGGMSGNDMSRRGSHNLGPSGQMPPPTSPHNQSMAGPMMGGGNNGGMNSSMSDYMGSNGGGSGGGREMMGSSSQHGNPNDPEWKVRIRHKQQRLLLLHHSSKCPFEDGKCKVTPYCGDMKKLWKHMARCTDNDCRVPHCFSSRSILSHYRKCKDPRCPACGPVRETVRKSQKNAQRRNGPSQNPNQSGDNSNPGGMNRNYGMACGGMNSVSNNNFGTSSSMGGPNMGGPNMGGPGMGGPNMGGPGIGGSNMGGPNMVSSNMGGPNMNNSNMGGPNMGGPNMGGPNMGNANMGGPNMVNGTMGGPNMGNSSMGNSNMGGPNLNSNMGGPNLNSNMGGPNMGGPNMGGPNLNSNMGGPNMGGPNMGGPNMGNSGMGNAGMGNTGMGPNMNSSNMGGPNINNPGMGGPNMGNTIMGGHMNQMNGPMDGAMNGAMNGPMNGPMDGIMNNQMDSTMKGPLDGPLNGPMGQRVTSGNFQQSGSINKQFPGQTKRGSPMPWDSNNMLLGQPQGKGNSSNPSGNSGSSSMNNNNPQIPPSGQQPHFQNSQTRSSGDPGSSTRNGANPSEHSRNKSESSKTKHKQQRLLLLRHASKCTFENGQCPVTPHCAEMKVLWKHIANCKDQHCKVKHCMSSRFVLSHYRRCKDPNCEACGPVRATIRNGATNLISIDPSLMTNSGAMADSSTSAAPQQDSSMPLAKKQKLDHQRKSTNGVTPPPVAEICDTTKEPIKSEETPWMRQQKKPPTPSPSSMQPPSGSAPPAPSPLPPPADPSPVQSETKPVTESTTSVGGVTTPLESTSKMRSSEIGSAGPVEANVQVKEEPNHESKPLVTPSVVSSGGKNIKKEPQRSPPPKLAAVAVPVVAPVNPKQAAEDHSLLECFTTDQIKTHIESLNKTVQLPPAKLKIKCLEVLKGLQTHEHGWVFASPVDPVELGLDDYFDIIKRPMDLGTIQKKLESGSYHSFEDFKSDVRLTFENAMKYNEERTVVHEMAKELKKKFESDYRKLMKDLEREHEENKKNDRACTLCGCEKLLFEPPVFFCNGLNCPSKRIRRNTHFYITADKQYAWCNQCFNELGLEIDLGTTKLKKEDLKKRKNDETHEESWVQCDDCERWIHQICGLYNTRQDKENKSAYSCPTCLLEKRKSSGDPDNLPEAPSAADIPRTKLSDWLEKDVHKKVEERLKTLAEEKSETENTSYEEALKALSVGGPVTIRQVTSTDRKLEVRDRMKARYAHKNYPEEFPYRCKCIVVFQNLDGVDVVLFALYVYEHGEDNPYPNKRTVYVSYLDSVHYMKPRKMRTFIYHEILISYLDFARRKGFAQAFIWACPPLKGDDYIFYAKPEDQKTPKDVRLRQWYLDMLVECQKRNIVGTVSNMYDQYFSDKKLDASSVPYFEGDYFPGEAENIIKLLEEGGDKRSGSSGKKKKKDSSKNKSRANASEPQKPEEEMKSYKEGGRDLVMQKFCDAIQGMKESFIVAFLNWKEAKPEHLIVPKEITEYRDANGIRTRPEDFSLDNLNDKAPQSRKRDMCGIIRPVNRSEKQIDRFGRPIRILDDDAEEIDCEFFNTRQCFLDLCRGNHYQFDELRRAKHTSMMVLWHLQNREAPKFVQQCFSCNREISSGLRHHCNICSDFDLCDECFKNPNANRGACRHKLEAIKVDNGQDGQEGGASGLTEEQRKERQRNIQLHITLIEHASRCVSSQCKSSNCQKMKSYLKHGQTCQVKASGGCKICKRIWTLLRIHAQQCKSTSCPIPQCIAIRNRIRQLQLKQQAMDDRRRQEMNRHYRMGMMSQNN